MNPKRPTPRHIIIKRPKVKDKYRILKATREKQFAISKRPPIRLWADFLAETFQSSGNLHEMFKVIESQDI